MNGNLGVHCVMGAEDNTVQLLGIACYINLIEKEKIQLKYQISGDGERGIL